MTTATGYEEGKFQPHESSWLSMVNRAIFIRASIVAVIIGSILTLINQSGWFFGNEPVEILQVILVFGLPFGVVTVSQIAALRRAYLDSIRHGEPATPERVTTTAVSHGIPARAVAIGLAFGSLNASVVLADVLLRSGDLAAVSVVSLGQAFVLPLLFAELSQVISYRRYRYQVVRSSNFSGRGIRSTQNITKEHKA